MKRLLLVDVDSKIPNLALMKLSTFHKEQGNYVELLGLNYSGYPHNRKQTDIDASEFDYVAVSIVFTVNKNKVNIVGNDNVVFGGTGVDIESFLPQRIDSLEEDYSLYPENDSSYGFITRGCIRNCWFCFVPEKEGTIQYYRDWQDIVKHKKTYFLDNNFLSYKKHKEILQELVEEKVRCQFNQGLDMRLIDDENAYLLSKMNYIGEYIFAFDDVRYEKMISSGLNVFQKHLDKDWKIKMFVYAHPSMAVENVLYRIKWCTDRKILPYLMRDKSCWESEYKDFYIDLAAYCNQPALIKKMTFEEYIFKRHPNNALRAEKSLKAWKEALGE